MPERDHPPCPSSKEAEIFRVLVAFGESYGLELVEASEGSLKRGTIYVTLQRMEEKRLVSSRQEEAIDECLVATDYRPVIRFRHAPMVRHGPGADRE